MRNIAKYPTPVIVHEIDDNRYLVNIVLNKNQLADLATIAGSFRASRSGQYNALVANLQDAINAFLNESQV